MDLTDKICIVTGSTSGIGLATAERMLDLGAFVLGVGRSEHTLAGVARYAPLKVDLRDAKAADEIIARCEEIFGLPDVLVNNAGIGGSKPILETTDEDLDRFILVNFKAPYLLCRSVIPGMLKKGGGSIVNIASAYGLIGASGSSQYSATKAALIGMSRSLAAELGRDGIRVNVVAPSTTVTAMNRDRISNDEWMRDAWVGTIPRGTPGEPIEVANAIAFLASDDASYISGAVLPVDGGWSVTKVMPRPRT